METTVCVRPGCQVKVKQKGTGRKKLYHSKSCRQMHYRQKNSSSERYLDPPAATTPSVVLAPKEAYLNENNEEIKDLHSYNLGRYEGFERAADILMDRAVDYFKTGRINVAQELRTLSEEIRSIRTDVQTAIAQAIQEDNEARTR